jgi:tRNA(adenine34) deaminase
MIIENSSWARDMENINIVDKDIFWMKQALALAKKSLDHGEIPIGALIIKNQKLISGAFNMPITTSDPTAHAEILVLRKAGQLTKNYRLPDTTLYTTIEPCTMCIGAMIHARISRLVFGAAEPKAGAVISRLKISEMLHYNHKLQVKGGVMAEEAKKLMTNFFKSKRTLR